MGVAAFWIALAAVIIASHWRKKMKEQMRHETVRLLIEKGEPLEQEQLRELLNPAPPPLPANHPWLRRAPSAYKQCRVVGTILMIAAPGVAAMVGGIGYSQALPQALWVAASVGVCMFMTGFAFFFVSRFVAPTEKRDEESNQVT
jgi:hypothetical protein